MGTPNTTPLPVRMRQRVFSLESLKFVVYLGTLIVAITVFVFASQGAQDNEIRKNCTAIERNATRHSEHAKHATQAFEKIDRTLTAQQELLTRTRETLIGVEVSQRQVVAEVKRLSEEVKKRGP